MIFRRALIGFVLGVWSALFLLAAAVVLAGSAHATEPHPVPSPAPAPVGKDRSCAWSADSFRSSDKMQHAAFSFVFAAGATAGTRDATTGFLLGMTPGLLKEYRDYRTGAGSCSGKDLVANAVGAALGAYVVRGLVLIPERSGVKISYYTLF